MNHFSRTFFTRTSQAFSRGFKSLSNNPVKTATVATSLPFLWLFTHGDKGRRQIGFSFVSASFIPKSEPKRGYVDRCGEDSYCIVTGKEATLLAVADGVGGWAKKGIDAGEFARTLMDQLGKVVKNQSLQGTDGLTKMIQIAFRQLQDYYTSGSAPKEYPPFGSSTCCAVRLVHSSGSMEYSNIGDSGFILLRPINNSGSFNSVGAVPTEAEYVKFRIVARSIPQQFRFNAPHQITFYPPDGRVTKAEKIADFAATGDIDVNAGDIVIVATDGFFDNVFDTEICDILSEMKLKDYRDASSDIGTKLVKAALEHSKNEERISPFTEESRRHGLDQIGGYLSRWFELTMCRKVDDITVLVGVCGLRE